MIATLQQQYCKVPAVSIVANQWHMEGLEADTALIKDLVRHTKLAPSQIAKRANMAATTILRPYRGVAESRLSQPTLEKLRKLWPDFPGWRTEEPDQIGMLGDRPDPNEKPDELVYVREVDISYAMGDGAVIEDYPAVGLIPFNLGFVRAISKATDTSKLFIATGHGHSMEPTLLRSDLVMVDTSQRTLSDSDHIWALNYGGGGLVKRVRTLPRNRIRILSDNSVVPPEEAALEDVYIVGKVVWVGRRM